MTQDKIPVDINHLFHEVNCPVELAGVLCDQRKGVVGLQR